VNNKTIAIHQPNFIPWLGYFFKVAQSDIFVLYDTAQFSKGSFTKRVRVHQSSKSIDYDYLSVPTARAPLITNIEDLQLLDSQNWKAQIQQKLIRTYGKAPYFQQIEQFMSIFLSENIAYDRSFSVFTSQMIQYIASVLELDTAFIVASESLKTIDKATESLVQFVKQLDGQTYLSGNGAKSYLIEERFEQEHINLIFSRYTERYKESSFDDHLYDKSIISYLAYHSYEEIAAFLNK